jgi:streptomycin 6-kinase
LRTGSSGWGSRSGASALWSFSHHLVGGTGERPKDKFDEDDERKGSRRLSWQTGYGAFSVSESNKSAVVEYIVNQETHHRKMTFQEEIRALLKKHSVRFDERYIWD